MRTRFALALLAPLALLAALAAPVGAADFPVCGSAARVTCVVDGDTFWLDGVKIRPEGYDAPEMGPPRCRRPAAGAREARAALAGLLGSGALGIEAHGRSYDRVLARVTIDGRDLAALMLATGLVRRYVPGAEPWC